MIGTALPMALRWQWLMRAQGMDDTFAWLTRAYFVSYTASQVLPTSIGGDAMRVYETARRHPGRTGDVTAIILLERGLGGAGTVLLGAIGFVLALGTYDVGAYLWLEGAFVLGTLVLIFLFFARSARPLLNRARPLLRRLRVERPLRALYDGVHHFRGHAGLLLGVFLFTTAIQAVRILSIWAAGRAVGIDLGPRIYYVMGPLFFLVLLVPFTLNGIAVREAFFVSFLGSVGVAADAGLRRRLPVLPRHDRARAAGRGDPPLGRAARRLAAAARAWLTRRAARLRRRHVRRASVDRAVPRERRGPRDRRRRQRLARTGRSSVVRERFPAVRLVESENRGLAAGWNRGVAETSGEHVLILNADAWLVGDAAERLRRRGRAASARRASSGRGLRNPDGSLQRSVRGFPTLWRLATEYLYLRKLAPRSRALNAFYAGGFAPRRRAHGRVGDGLVHARPSRRVRRGRPVRRALLPLQRGGRLDAARHGSRLVGRLHADGRVRPRRRRLARRHGSSGRTSAGTCGTSRSTAGPGEAEHARRLLRASLLVRGRLHRGERARLYREVGTWLGSGDVETLIAA